MKSVAILFLAVLLSACAGGSTVSEVLSIRQIDALATEILDHTPEHVHFAGNPKFVWVLLLEEQTVPPDLAKRVHSLLAERYVVYTTRGQVPPDHIRNDQYGMTYLGGFQFSYRVTVMSSTEVTAEYSDYEASLAASHQMISYKWRSGRWIVTYRGPTTVS